jgi:diguanylate cyclase (GGDEF)-like protein
MAEKIRDARVRELEFLGKLERNKASVSAAELADPAMKALVVHLLAEGYANGLDTLPVNANERTDLHREFGGKSVLLIKHEERLWRDMGYLLASQQVFLAISHKGRVRRSELEQALRTGRDRDTFGILWDARHREQGVMMAVLGAQPSSPVTIAYLDMNGLKSINDEHGHAAGDLAIRTYLQTVSVLMGDRAEAFRGGTSDEVVVVLRDTPAADARTAMRAVLKQLGKERIVVDGSEVVPFLTAACGIADTIDPARDPSELVQRADLEQKRAKEASKAIPGVRASYLAVERGDLERVG